MSVPNPVESTSHIRFNKEFKTFSLYAGNTLYSFCIGPELQLEHLYWGVKLEEGYDLRYLSQSMKHSHFSTVVEVAAPMAGKICSDAETLQEVQQTWKNNNSMGRRVPITDMAAVQRRRLENYSWRILSKATQNGNANRQQQNQSFNVLSTPRPSRKKKTAAASNPPQTQAPSSLAASMDLSSSSLEQHGSSWAAPRKRPSLTKLSELFEKNLASHQATPPSQTPPRLGGRRIRRAPQAFERALGKIGRGLLCCEYADYGTGDFRSPSFIVVDNLNGSSISPLRYRRHTIYRGKLPMPDGLPGIRCHSAGEASTLVVTMADAITGLEVDLVYVVMHNYDAITKRAVFHNRDHRPCNTNDVNSCSLNPEGNSKVIQKACSVTVDFEATSSPFYLVHLSGSWARERFVCETHLTHGLMSIGSMRGVSGHVHNPFAAVCIGQPSETHGEVRGFSFMYSGNFLAEAEITETGRLRFNMGIHPMGMQWHLMPQETFHTPEVVLTRSSEGLGGLSRTIHRLFLDRLLPRNWSDEDPPILLNSWEAKYFHVNHNNIVEMAHQAAKVGINMIVLDDGWFERRNDDNSGLGDWVVDRDKFPRGIKGLAEDVNAAGCKFGIWFEPEMVSADSNLHTAHPEWYLHVPGRPRQTSRNQFVLDFSRKEVVDYVFVALSNIISSANVEYVKWDMNRPLTEVYSAAAGMGEVWQAEVGHRYMLGVYQLQERLTSAFPHVLLENCASGGGRFDPGMLYYSPQIWCSDNMDALTRMKIQYGTSLAYPARCIGAHVSTVPDHITGSTTRLRTRAFVAMCGTFGFELDISKATEKDLAAFKTHIDIYKQIHPIVRWGDLYRLWDPFKLNLAAWMYVSRDKSQAVVFAFSLNSDHWSNLVPRLQLQGLLPDAEYEVSEPLPNDVTQSSGTLMIIETEVRAYQLGLNNVILTGQTLMSAGLPIKFYTLDDSLLFILNRVPTDRSTPATSPRSAHKAPRPPLLKTRSTSALETSDDESAGLPIRGRKLYSSNVLAAASRSASPSSPFVVSPGNTPPSPAAPVVPRVRIGHISTTSV